MANSYSLDLEASSSQFAAIGDGSQTGLDLSGDHTVEVWVKFESLPTNGASMVLVSKHGASGSFGYFWGIYNNAGTYQVRGGWSSNGTNFDTHAMNITAPSTGTWTHIAVSVVISTHTSYAYKDGVFQNSDATGTLTSINNNNQTFFNGAIDQGSPSSFFDGKMDELRVWSVTRTATEIANNIYKDVTGQTGLKLYCKYENDFTDASGNGNTLYNNNGATFSSDVPFNSYITDGGQFLFNFV